MKKKLSSLLVFALVLTMLAPAFAFAAAPSDIATSTHKDAINELVALGVINGYEDGTFKPSQEITRAEFAKIAVIAAGKQTSAAYFAGTGNFNDVSATAWYAKEGWVGAAKAFNLVQGYNGNFRPEDKIKTEEVVTVLLRILGYNDKLPGEWPINYVAKASDLGVLTSDFAMKANASREIVAGLSANVLAQKAVTYDATNNVFNANVAGDTLLKKSFGNAMTDAVVTETPAVYGTTLAANQAKFGSATVTFADNVVFAGAASVNDLLGHSVSYITVNGKVVFVSNATAATSVQKGTITGAVYPSWKLVLDGVAVSSQPSVDANAVFYFNNQKQADVNAFDTNVASNASAWYVLNASGKVQAVFANQYDTTSKGKPLASTSAATTLAFATLTYYTNDLSTSSTVTLDSKVAIFRDGKSVSLSDLKKYDVIYLTKVGTKVTKVEAYSGSVTGSVSSKSVGATTTVVVNGNTYTLSAIGDTVNPGTTNYVFGLSNDGTTIKVARVVASENSDVTGVITGYAKKDILEGNVVKHYEEFTVFTAAGTSVTKLVELKADGSSNVNAAAKQYGTMTFKADGTFNVYTNTINDVTSAVYAVGIDTNGLGTSSIKVTGTDAGTYFVTSNTKFIDVTTVTSGGVVVPKVITFADLKADSKLYYTRTGNNLDVVLVQAGGVAQAANYNTDIVGLYQSKSSVTDASGTIKNYVVVAVNGVNQTVELETAAAATFTANELVVVSDTSTGGIKGKYDTVIPATNYSTVTSLDSSVKTFVANNTKFGVTSNTIIYIIAADGTVSTGVFADLAAEVTNINASPAATWLFVKGSGVTYGVGSDTQEASAILIKK